MNQIEGQKRRAVFIDRDGVLNRMVYDETHGTMDSPRRPEQVKLIAGAGSFIRSLRDAGWVTAVVTNQPGVAKGTMTMGDLEAVNDQVSKGLAEEGAKWDAIYSCPHHPEQTETSHPEFVKTCDCRKPKAGMLLRAAAELDVDTGRSWMVGDGIVDVQAGRAAGCRTILISNMKLDILEQMFRIDEDMPDFIAPNLEEALEIIQKQSG